MLFAAVHKSLFGAKRTSSVVRCPVGYKEGKADMTRTVHFGAASLWVSLGSSHFGPGL